VYKGAYDNGVTYAPNDYVTLNGSSYVFINYIGAAGYGPITHPAAWQLVANKGDTGATGATGANGTPADLSLYATLASPTFTGTPNAPTASAGTATTQLATTGFVTTANNLKSNIASPTFTGTPAAPTAATSTNTTQIATTAYVKANLSSYATTSALTSALTGYTATASLNNQLIATDVSEIYSDSYTLTVSDANSVIKINNEGTASSHAIYLPDDTTTALPIGSQIVFVQMDSYNAVFSATVAGYMYCRGSRTTMNGQYAVATAIKVAANTWVLSGDLV
jgi:hypothetical protein